MPAIDIIMLLELHFNVYSGMVKTTTTTKQKTKTNKKQKKTTGEREPIQGGTSQLSTLTGQFKLTEPAQG